MTLTPRGGRIAAMPHPARCPGCGAGVKLTLSADPGTPVYECHSTPYRIVCASPAMLTDWTSGAPVLRSIDENLATLTSLERHELRGLFLGLVPTVNAPHVDLCLEAECEKVAIDGVCLGGHGDLDADDD